MVVDMRSWINLFVAGFSRLSRKEESLCVGICKSELNTKVRSWVQEVLHGQSHGSWSPSQVPSRPVILNSFLKRLLEIAIKWFTEGFTENVAEPQSEIGTEAGTGAHEELDAQEKDEEVITEAAKIQFDHLHEADPMDVARRVEPVLRPRGAKKGFDQVKTTDTQMDRGLYNGPWCIYSTQALTNKFCDNQVKITKGFTDREALDGSSNWPWEAATVQSYFE
uniref:Uncharacterized protein n=1 Tax=Solanum tuberosum TaxID=4113 RepID=M1DLT9_SOLTU